MQGEEIFEESGDFGSRGLDKSKVISSGERAAGMWDDVGRRYTSRAATPRAHPLSEVCISLELSHVCQDHLVAELILFLKGGENMSQGTALTFPDN